MPASVLAMTGTIALAPLADPLGHAHEMLFGFALAVVAGNQLGPARGPRVVALLALWGASRVAFLAGADVALAGGLNAAFALALAVQVTPRLFRAAKKWRNLALPAALAGLCAADIAWQLVRYAAAPQALRSALLATVLLFSLLLAFMGGRIIAPAVAGQLHRQGEALDARVQPRVEAAMIIACLVALAALLVHVELVAAIACAVAGALAAVRLMRWRLWAVRARADLWCLASGYGWLALGLVAFGAALAAGRYESAAIHLITVGALGTLTLNVMAMSRLGRVRFPAEHMVASVGGTALIVIATLCRVSAAFHPWPWLLVAALLWAAAFVLLAALFLRARTRA